MWKHKNVYLANKLKKLLKKQKNSMQKPVLLKTDSNGGTIHSYQLTGGRTTYDKYLACNKGQCVFNNTLQQAQTCLEKMT